MAPNFDIVCTPFSCQSDTESITSHLIDHNINIKTFSVRLLMKQNR